MLSGGRIFCIRMREIKPKHTLIRVRDFLRFRTLRTGNMGMELMPDSRVHGMLCNIKIYCHHICAYTLEVLNI